jgi:N-acetylmuramoyl-L-alanine amidase
MKVVIDPGHGGSDTGAVGFGLREADVVLQLAELVGEHSGSMKVR